MRGLFVFQKKEIGIVYFRRVCLERLLAIIYIQDCVKRGESSRYSIDIHCNIMFVFQSCPRKHVPGTRTLLRGLLAVKIIREFINVSSHETRWAKIIDMADKNYSSTLWQDNILEADQKQLLI